MLLIFILSIPPLVMLWRFPVLRRLAIRNATRRPRETFLVVLGSMLGTAIITGSFLVGDTLNASISRSAFTRLGPVDVIAVAPGGDPRALADKVRAAVPPADTDGVIAMARLTAAVATIGPNPVAEPQASLLEVDFDEARAFGGDPDATGIDGVTPAPGHGVIGRDLARTLDVGPGDTVRAYAYGQQTDVVIDAVLPRRGLAGFGLGQGSESPNLFVAPFTIGRLVEAAGGAKGVPPQAIVAVSATGSVLGGLDRSESIASVTEAAVGRSKGTGVEAILGNASVARVIEVKQQVLDSAKSQGEQFTQLFGTIGFFSVLSGIFLLVMIFVMLAEERKTELGMLRAIGLRRWSLLQAFCMEGWLYALGAAALGGLGGIAVGRLIVAAASGVFARRSGMALEMTYSPSFTGIQRGMAIGFTLSLLTVMATSISIARLNVIRAIRDLPDPESDQQRPVTLVLAAVGVVVGVLMLRRGVVNEMGIPLLAGPALMAFGVVTLLRRFVSRRPLVTGAAGAVLVWNVIAFEVVPRAFNAGGVEVFVVLGVILTATAVAIISQNQDVVGHLVRMVGGGSRSMSLRLGLAYPLAKRFRTAMILTMYSLVMFTLTFITVFSYLFGTQIDTFTKRISGGFDLSMTSNGANPVAAEDLLQVDGVDKVSVITHAFGEFDIARTPDFVEWEVGSYDRSYIETGTPELADRLGRFDSDRAVYEAVLTDPTLVIVPQFFLADGGGPPPSPPNPGERIKLRDQQTGAVRELTVVAIAESGFGNALPFVHPAVIDEMFGSRAVANVVYVATEDGVDPQDVAESINGRFLPNGADADSYRKLIGENLSQQQGFFRLMQGYLSLGLVVGIAGLGVVMVRAVRERRRQIGVLRAIGFDGGAIRRAFVSESAFVALEGIGIGAGLALVTAWRLLGNERFGADMQFTVPWAPLALLIGGTFIASMIATAAPAMQASRIKPAVALRMTD